METLQHLALHPWGNITSNCMSGIWKKTLKKFVNDFKGFTKDEEAANIHEAAVDIANHCEVSKRTTARVSH